MQPLFCTKVFVMIHMCIITRRIIFDDGNKVTSTRGQSFALDLVMVAVHVARTSRAVQCCHSDVFLGANGIQNTISVALRLHLCS